MFSPTFLSHQIVHRRTIEAVNKKRTKNVVTKKMNNLEPFGKPRQYWDEENYGENDDDDEDVDDDDDDDDVVMNQSEKLRRPRWSKSDVKAWMNGWMYRIQECWSYQVVFEVWSLSVDTNYQQISMNWNINVFVHHFSLTKLFINEQQKQRTKNVTTKNEQLGVLCETKAVLRRWKLRRQWR